jgi:glycine oxidase
VKRERVEEYKLKAMTNPSDIIVIGAGIVGCAIADELAHRGASVEIIDERPVGMGATQASAGVLAPYIETREGHPLLDLTVRSLGLYDSFVERAVGESGVPVSYRRTGTITIAVDEADWPVLQASADFLSRCGVAASLLDAAAAREAEPHFANSALGALLIEDHGFVGANDLTRALVTSARRCGAQLIEQSRVRRIFEQGDDLVVETDRGTLHADAVVIAAGSWSGEIGVDRVASRLPVRPVRGQLLYLNWTGTPLRRVTWTHRCYFVPWDDGTLLVGATMEEAGFDERVTVAGVRDLLESACELVPHAWSAGFRGARVGLRPGTPDDLPVIGVSASMPKLFYATGHYRNGVLLAPLTAQLVADALVGKRSDPALARVSPARFGL